MKEVLDFLKPYRKYIYIFLLLVVVFSSCNKVVSTYNQIVKLSQGVDLKWSQVENVYQRRSDLIPNLVEIVKGYAEHEKSTLEGVINARAKATSITVNADDAESLQKYNESQGGLSQALGRLMVVSEQYPDLKANENYKQLMTELSGTENRISIERKAFNEAVIAYNNAIIVFPKNIIASLFGFTKKAYFKAETGSDKAPKIKMTSDLNK